MSEMKVRRRDHMRMEEMEALALEGGRRLRARQRAHLVSCERCREAVEELRVLQAAFVALPAARPPDDLIERVMRRVRLPATRRASAWETVRGHWAAATAAVAGLVAVVGTGAAILFRYPELTPVTVAGFLLRRGTELMWGAVVDASRLLVDAGIVSLAQAVAEQVTPVTAFAAVATVVVVGLGALRIMLNLMNISPVWRIAPGR